MKTKMLQADEQGLTIAAKIIRENGIVAFPTETVYGLGANALSNEACKKIFTAKKRPTDNPLIVHIADFEALAELVVSPSAEALQVANSFWPGPLSIILNARTHLPPAVTAGLGTVAVRFPSHQVAQRLIRKCGCPIAAPSANISGKPSATRAEHVMRDFQGKISAVIDGGPCQVGLESTVIDGTTLPLKILRPGAITYEMLKQLVPVELATVFSGGQVLSPGTKYTHYNPEAEVILIKGSILEIQRKIKVLNSEIKNYAILGLGSIITEIDLNQASIIETVDSIEALAERLYSFFRECDAVQIPHIILHEVDEKGLGLALMNRIVKAANVVYEGDRQ